MLTMKYERSIMLGDELLDETYYNEIDHNNNYKMDFRFFNQMGSMIYRKTMFLDGDGTFNVLPADKPSPPDIYEMPTLEQIAELIEAYRLKESEPLPRNPNAVALVLRDSLGRIILEKRPDFDAMGEPVTDPGMLSLIVMECLPDEAHNADTALRILAEITGIPLNIVPRASYGRIYQPYEGRMLDVYYLSSEDWDEFLSDLFETDVNGLVEMYSRRNLNTFYSEDLEARIKAGEVNSVTRLILETFKEAWPESRLEDMFGEIISAP